MAGSSTVVAAAAECVFYVKLSSHCRKSNVTVETEVYGVSVLVGEANGSLRAGARQSAAACNFQLNSSKCKNNARNARVFLCVAVKEELGAGTWM